MLKRAVSKAAGESKPEAYPQGSVEDSDEPRTTLTDFFSILLDGEKLFRVGSRQPPESPALAGTVQDRHFQTLQRELLIPDLLE